MAVPDSGHEKANRKHSHLLMSRCLLITSIRRDRFLFFNDVQSPCQYT